jgi:hypothetical protein
MIMVDGDRGDYKSGYYDGDDDCNDGYYDGDRNGDDDYNGGNNT